MVGALPTCGLTPSSLAGARLQQQTVRLTTSAASTGSPGNSKLKVSPIGIGTIKWGDSTAGYGKQFTQESLEEVFKTATQDGKINFFDTAEVYGYQSLASESSAEYLLGKYTSAQNSSNDDVVVATKYFTIPWTNLLIGGGLRLGKQALLSALECSLKKLNKTTIDLYQIHFPFPTYSQDVLADALAEALDRGLASNVGVSNYSIAQMKEMSEALAKRGGKTLVSNQVKYSMLDRSVEENGLLEAAADMGITIIAYSPLDKGLLSQLEAPPSLWDRGKGKDFMSTLQLQVDDIASRVGNELNAPVTRAQVALNYLRYKGVVPIPGTASVQTCQDIVQALSWSLGSEQFESLDSTLKEGRLETVG